MTGSAAGVEREVAIVGGGPAGLALAIELARREVASVVLEAGELPQRHKPCGEGLMPTGVERLTALDARRRLDPDGHQPFRGLHYVSPRGRVAEADFRDGPGLGIRRDALSRALLDVAREHERIEIRTGCRARSLAVGPRGATIGTERGTVRARLVVGADGLHSRVRSMAGLDGSLAARKRYGLRQHFAIAPWSSRVEVHWSHGVEAYVTPVGPRCVGVAMLWDRARRPTGAAGPDAMRAFLGLFPALVERLAHAEPSDTMASTGPLAHSTRGVVAERVALLGDASGYLDAITGEGLSLAFDEAQALAELLPGLLAADRLSATDLAPYARAHRRITAPYYRFTGLVLALGRSPLLVERLVAMLERHPELFSHFLDVNMGRAGLAALGPGGWARAVTGFVRPGHARYAPPP